MQPEVLAWALLFVVGFSVIYRFFAWAGRRSRREPSSPAVSLDAAAIGEKTSAPPPEPAPLSDLAKALPTPEVPLVGSASVPMPQTEPSQPAAKPIAVFADPPRPAPASDYAVAVTAVPSSVLPTAPAESADAGIATTANSPASSAVLSARIAAQAVRLALAPSVAATLPPRVPLKPSLAATLPPALSASPSKPAFAATGTFPVSEAVAKPMVASAPTPISAESVAPPLPAPTVERTAPRTLRFRALRIGAELISLDIRLREARERKVQQTPKILRRAAEMEPTKELRVLVPKVAPEKAPARRIGRKAGDVIVLASTQGRTRIIGAAQRTPRVLSEPRI